MNIFETGEKKIIKKKIKKKKKKKNFFFYHISFIRFEASVL